MSETIEQARARVAAAAERVRPGRERKAAREAAERAFEVEMLVVAQDVEVVSYSEPRDDAPFDMLADRVGARLTVALIGWLIRRHPRVTRDDREGPSAWTSAPLGTVLPVLSVDELAALGITLSPTDDPACLAAYDGFGTSYPDRVTAIAQAYARYADTWIALPEADLQARYRRAVWNAEVAQRNIDAWKAGRK